MMPQTCPLRGLLPNEAWRPSLPLSSLHPTDLQGYRCLFEGVRGGAGRAPRALHLTPPLLLYSGNPRSRPVLPLQAWTVVNADGLIFRSAELGGHGVSHTPSERRQAPDVLSSPPTPAGPALPATFHVLWDRGFSAPGSAHLGGGCRAAPASTQLDPAVTKRPQQEWHVPSPSVTPTAPGSFRP